MGSREVWSRISRPRNAGGTPALGWAAGVRPWSGDERGRRYAIPGRWGYVIIEGTRGGSSSIGRAPDCGSGRCGFNSRLPPHFATACGWSQPRFTPSLQSGPASGLRKFPRLRCEIAPSTACAVLAGAPPSGYFLGGSWNRRGGRRRLVLRRAAGRLLPFVFFHSFSERFKNVARQCVETAAGSRQHTPIALGRRCNIRHNNMRLILTRQFRCPACGGREGYRSRSRNESEKVFLRFFLLRAIRCVSCRGRYYAPFFMRMRPD